LTESNSNLRPVLILGAAPRVAVPIAKLLRQRCGIAIDVAAMMASDAKLRSRAVRNFFHLPDIQTDPQAFSKSLISLIREHQYDMLIPVQDGAVAAIAQNYDALRSLLHVACPPPHIVERVLDKNVTLNSAEQCGIRIPRTYRVSTVADLENLRPKPAFPAVVKPVERKGVDSFKARYFRSSEQLASFLESNSYGELLLQEYCPGVGIGIEMLIHKGECLASFQHRRLKEDPPSGGVAVMAIAEETDPVLAEASYRLLRALEWEGVAMVEFRKDLANGSSALMEINGRYWGTTSLPLQAGVEFPVYEWRLAHGHDPQIPQNYSVGMRWRWTTGYVERLHRILLGFRGGIEPRVSRFKALKQIPADFLPIIRDAMFSVSDPVPALAETMGVLGRLIWGDLRAAYRKLLPRRFKTFLERYQRLEPRARSVYLKLQLKDTLGMPDLATRRTTPRSARSFVTVCFGNIMRSPMAGLMLRDALASHEVDGAQVKSAGLHARAGREAHPWAVAASREIGLPLDDHVAQPLTEEMVAHADAILAMDFENLAELLIRYPESANKMFMLSAYGDETQRCHEIADPYFGDLEETRGCYASIKRCVQNLAASLEAESKTKSHSKLPQPQLAGTFKSATQGKKNTD